MNDLRALTPEELASQLTQRVTGKAAIVGVGNIMRGDDGLGPKAIELLRAQRVNASLFDCGTAPENYIFPILSSGSQTVIFIDAADMRQAPGAVAVVDIDRISALSFSTHAPSPRLMIDLLKTGKEDIAVFAVAMQPASTTLGRPLSGEIVAGLGSMVNAFIVALGKRA